MQTAAMGLVGAGVPWAAPAGARRNPIVGPRYVVVLFLRGGMDGVYTTDPKTRAEVAAKVDVPYNANEIVDAGGLQFGPHYAKMKRWAGKMAVLHGVQVRTANHESGAMQMLRMKTAVTANMPGILDVIGQEREQPLASVTMGTTSSLEHSPGGFGGPTADSENTIVDALDDLKQEDLDVLARTYRRHLERSPRWATSAAAVRTRDHLEQAAALFEKLKTTKPFAAENWAGRDGLGRDLQRTLWFLENDLTRGVFVKVFFDWDSHYNNARKQTSANLGFVEVIDRFFEELQQRRNAGGTLADQTMLVIGSELGRFPLLNTNLGKDHFPETTLTFLGPNINTADGKGARFVPTGRMMEGLKVSLKTGQPDKNGTEIFLDDVGATMLHAVGMNPALYGYRGRRLTFLERA
jgi:uncharacterized protein (DUF1501 family)